jgi:hypothetical protein
LESDGSVDRDVPVINGAPDQTSATKMPAIIQPGGYGKFKMIKEGLKGLTKN